MKPVQYLLAGMAIMAAFAAGFAFSYTPQPTADLGKKHRIVFQMTTADTAAYRALTRQLGNIRKEWPDAQIEVVAHNKGIGMLLKEKTNIQPELSELSANGVQFFACENTLKQQKLEKSQVVEQSGFVPGGLVHIVTRQEQGWAYIKGGF